MPSDIQWAMEWATEEALRCSGCGHPRDVTMAKGADQDFDATAMRCHACEAIRVKRNGWKGDDLASHYFSVHKAR